MDTRIAAATLVVACCFLPAPADGQTGCTYTIRLTAESLLTFNSQGYASVVRIDAPSGCPWTAASSAPFVTVHDTSGVTSFGSSRVSFSVGPNFAPTSRSARIRIADQFITITQGRGVPIVDFNGDGRFDFLWHNRADGRISTWLMDGILRIEGPSFSPPRVADTNWELVGSGDLNGDGHADLVWQNNADGRVAAWLMNRLRQVSGAALSIPRVTDRDWRIRALCDLNGDGRADLFWQHQTRGLVAVWLMDGLTVVDASLLRAPGLTDLNWRLVGASGGLSNGALYGVGARLDDALTLLWQHDRDGRLAVWYLSGLELLAGFLTGDTVSDTNWKIAALGDLDRDGIPDYVWQHQTDGRLSVWFRGYGPTNRPDLGVVADTTWRLAGPR